MSTLTKQAVSPVAQKPSALNFMASRLSIEPTKLLAILKNTVFKGANDEELGALVIVSNEYDLNPLLKEIYAFPAKGGGICPIVSVDGWNKMLLRHKDYDGKEFTFEKDDAGNLVSCTAIIYIKGRERPEKITEYLSECERNTDNWKNMPHRMLRNRTLCQASRMAFGFSGVYHEDEASAITIESTVVPAEPPPKLVTLPPREAKPTVQAELEVAYLAAGLDLDQVIKVLEESGLYPDAGSITSIAELPKEIAQRVLKNITGFLKMCADLKALQTP